jgi:hypothetical protein
MQFLQRSTLRATAALLVVTLAVVAGLRKAKPARLADLA